MGLPAHVLSVAVWLTPMVTIRWLVVTEGIAFPVITLFMM